jgi:predicted amidophosphoribosyltransferase
MSYKSSCRACGAAVTSLVMCNVCKEHISWICTRCYRKEDVTHMHRPIIVQSYDDTEKI